MCYDIKYQTRKKLVYAKRIGASEEDIRDLERQLEILGDRLPAMYHASGFSHPELVVFTNEAPMQPQLFQWGLIPFWVKDSVTAVKISNDTLNARGETIFEKPSFREAAKKRRCLILVDGFYEHHHFNGKTYPFHISLKNDEPMVLAGLWEKWELKDQGISKYTVSIVTTKANELMAKIHNNPKLAEARMPVILPKELENKWLKPLNDDLDKKGIQELLRPYDNNEMMAHTVRRLRGKEALGNKPEVAEEWKWEELEF
jgi:putative SOS response-associated peptidase YedK